MSSKRRFTNNPASSSAAVYRNSPSLLNPNPPLLLRNSNTLPPASTTRAPCPLIQSTLSHRFNKTHCRRCLRQPLGAAAGLCRPYKPLPLPQVSTTTSSEQLPASARRINPFHCRRCLRQPPLSSCRPLPAVLTQSIVAGVYDSLLGAAAGLCPPYKPNPLPQVSTTASSEQLQASARRIEDILPSVQDSCVRQRLVLVLGQILASGTSNRIY